MEIKEFEKIFRKYLEKINLEISEDKIKKFYKYMLLLLEWNEKINLTAITDPEGIILKHFVDSLTISKYIKRKDKVVDVGTGAGFPGIPIKIYNEDIELTLVDSLNKRIKFLEKVIINLELDNVCTIHSRAEEFGKNKKYREKFDISTSRAVANMSTLSEYLLPLVKINGNSIVMKGSNVEEEVIKSKNAIKILGGKIIEQDCFNLANTENIRNIIIVKKIKSTPSRYPRKPGTPARDPII